MKPPPPAKRLFFLSHLSFPFLERRGRAPHIGYCEGAERQLFSDDVAVREGEWTLSDPPFGRSFDWGSILNEALGWYRKSHLIGRSFEWEEFETVISEFFFVFEAKHWSTERYIIFTTRQKWYTNYRNCEKKYLNDIKRIVKLNIKIKQIKQFDKMIANKMIFHFTFTWNIIKNVIIKTFTLEGW